MSELGEGFDVYAHLRERPGAGATCPHCRGVGGVDKHDELFVVCKLCGAPRIVMPQDVPLGETATGALARADRLRKSRGMMRALGLMGVLGTAFGTIVALPTLFLSVTWALVVLAVVAAPSLLTYLYTRAQRASKSREIAAALDAAWAAAATEVFAAKKAKSPQELSRALGIDATRAQQLMTMLTVDAEIGGQVRIDTAPAQLPPDPRFAALEERAATEEAASAEAEPAPQVRLAAETDAEANARTK